MNLIESLQERYRFSYADLAALAGCSKSLISMAAGEKRQLPPAVAHILIALHEAFEGSAEADIVTRAEPVRAATNAQRVTWLEQHASLCTAQAQALENKAETARKTYAACLRRWAGICNFGQATKNLRPAALAYMAILEDRIREELTRNAPEKTDRLTIQVETLRFQGARAQAMAADLKKNI